MIFNTQIWFIILFFSLASTKVINPVLPEKPPSNKNNNDNLSYLLGCGIPADNIDSDGRKWSSDANFLINSSKPISAKAQVQDPSLPSPVPYMTARIFVATSSYNFSVSRNKRYWLRLHFYPTAYSILNPANAYFDVVSNGFTLLRNFSANITAQALSQAYFVKEFSILPSVSGFLNLTFSFPSDKEKAYAFVNGIELIPMPDIFGPAGLVGFEDQSIDVETSYVQTMFRLNVGGQYIPVMNDSGLTRTWYDDSPYLYGAAIGVTSQANETVKIEYPDKSNVSSDIAPLDVYSTARSMGPDAKVNQNYNLTWVFQIDPNFTYFVRFHFCEFIFSKTNQRVFDIYVNNQTAQEAADVIGWAGKQGVPVYKDYAAYVSDVPGDDKLWIALHPTVEMKPQYYDAILNGLEIFKLNDSSSNLAGPNPSPSELFLKIEENARNFASNSQGTNVPLILGILGGIVGFAFMVIALIVVYKVKTNKNKGENSFRGNWLPLYGNSYTSSSAATTNTSRSTISGKSNASSHLSSLAQGLCRHFSLWEIKQGTKNFSESNVIGVGGFGKVYEGIIDKGIKVAVKRSNPSSEQGVHEFQTEIEMLSKLRHKHLVSLIGFCEEEGEMILVYDYMANGTLREHLYKSDKPALTWKQRLEICIGAARGLHYLHTGATYTIIHRDVKTTNILLDEKWVAKVSDFGLSKTGPNLNQTHVSTMVKGSFGYLDPEYFRRQQLTEKSDVYSFGVVLFEVLCARPALNPSLPKEQVSLGDWALLCIKKNILEDIIDPHIKGMINQQCLKKFIDTAKKCLSDHGIDRPSMGDVLWNLEFALQLQENPEETEFVSNNKDGNDTSVMPTTIRTIDEECVISEETNDTGRNNTEIFSQIVNPKGR